MVALCFSVQTDWSAILKKIRPLGMDEGKFAWLADFAKLLRWCIVVRFSLTTTLTCQGK